MTFVPEKNILQTFILYKDGNTQEQKSQLPLLRSYIFVNENQLIGKILKKEYAKPFLSYILQHLPKTLQWLDINKLPISHEQEKLNLISFFLIHSHFQDEWLWYWNFIGIEEIKETITTHEEGLEWILAQQTKKSVKKALYQTYEKQKTQEYFPKTDAIFCRIFTDENFLVPLLQLPKKHYLFQKFEFSLVLQVLEFLQNYYTQKELYKLFCDALVSKEPYDFFQDIFRMFHTYNDNTEELFRIYTTHFTRVRANVQAIHDEIARINRRYINQDFRSDVDVFEPFVYKEEIKKSFVSTMEHLEFRLPKNADELYKWANTLQNCMASYVHIIREQKIYIVGVFSDNKLLYALELELYSLIQAKGKYNKQIPDNDMDVIHQWLKTCKKMK